MAIARIKSLTGEINLCPRSLRRRLRADDPGRDDEAQDDLRARAGVEEADGAVAHIPHAGLLMVPMTGHTVNIEEPMAFNQGVAEFFAGVESGRWGTWRKGAK